jgi:hypothetical protein
MLNNMSTTYHSNRHMTVIWTLFSTNPAMFKTWLHDPDLVVDERSWKEFQNCLNASRLRLIFSEHFPDVGILPEGYVRTNPLPQIPTKQNVPASRERLPGYFGIPTVIPMLRSLIGPAISKVQTPRLSCH